MNLSAYDKVDRFVPKDNYIQTNYKRLLSRTIMYRDKYCILKHYDSKDNSYSYFVAVFDDKQENLKHKFLKKDSDGYVKVYLSDIWDTLPSYVTKENNNIDVELVETQNDGEVYKLIF